jgi:hypothetical protein
MKHNVPAQGEIIAKDLKYTEKKNLLQNQLTNLNQIWNKLSLWKGNSKLLKYRARSLSKWI